MLLQVLLIDSRKSDGWNLTISHAGSLAAGLQSAIYGGATGGVFSVLQSIGATAVLAPPVAIGLGAGALVAGAGCVAVSYIKNSGTRSEESENEKREEHKCVKRE